MNLDRWDLDAERELIAHGCMYGPYQDGGKGALCNFVKYAFGVALNEDLGGWWDERVHADMVDWLELQARTWIKKRKKRGQGRHKAILCIPRTGGKSVCATEALSCWIGLHLINAAITISSENDSKAEKFLRAIKAVLSGSDRYSLFTWLYGNWQSANPRERAWTTSAIVHQARKNLSRTEPSIDTCSVNTGSTGNHPDMVVFDDPISEEKLTEEEGWLLKVDKHAKAMIPVVLPNGFVLIVATRYRDADMIGRAAMEEGLASISGMMPTDTRLRVDPDDPGPWHLYYLEARREDGTPTFPNTWSDAELKAYEKRAPLEYLSQMMNRPDVGPHMPLSQAEIKEMIVETQPKPDECVLTIHLDTAFLDSKKKNAGDESVIVTWAHFRDGSGNVAFMGGRGSKNYTNVDFEQHVINEVKERRKQGYYVRALTDEMESSGKQGTWRTKLRSAFNAAGVQPPPIIMLQRYGAGQRKINRLRAAAAYWKSGNVSLVGGSRGLTKLIDQMARIGMVAHDDWADASADVFHDQVYNATRRKVESKRGRAPLRPTDVGLLYVDEEEAERIHENWSKMKEGRPVYNRFERRMLRPPVRPRRPR